MRILAIVLFALACFTSTISCEKELKPCENFIKLDGDIEVNGEKLLINNTLLSSPDSLAIYAPYEVSFESIGSGCEEIHRLRFYVTIPKGEKLAGDFEILNTNVYTPNKSTSFSYDVRDQTKQITFFTGNSGKVSVQDLGNREYKFTINAIDPEGKTLKVTIRHKFQ
jgi:hypothetical protein